jgi:hypothetical protein
MQRDFIFCEIGTEYFIQLRFGGKIYVKFLSGFQCWLDKQHMTLWQGLAGTQRQARELISGPHIAAKTRLLSLIEGNPG